MPYVLVKDKAQTNSISNPESPKVNKGSNFCSIESNLLTKEELQRKRKKESLGYIIGIVSQLVWALNSIQIKKYEPWFPNTFSNNSLLSLEKYSYLVYGLLFLQN